MATPQYLTDAYNELPARYHHIILSVHDKGTRAAANVIVGETMSVRSAKDKRYTTHGTILAARVHRLRFTPKSVGVVFEVDLQSVRTTLALRMLNLGC